MWKRENEFDDLVAAAADAYSVPAWAIKATIGKESSFDPAAESDEQLGVDRSRGLMMVRLSTARDMGFDGPADQLSDPRTNINLGTKYLAYQRGRFGLLALPWDQIYAAYNAGRVRWVTVAGKQVLANEANVIGWRKAADHFFPGWRKAVPFGKGSNKRAPARS